MKKECNYLQSGLEICGGNYIMKTGKVGIYAGSFDPFTVGHLDIVNQAKLLFDRIIIARGQNPNKPPHVNSLPEDTLRGMGIDVTIYEGLLPELIKRWEKYAGDVTLIRGLRSGYDLNDEQNMLAFLREMHPTIKVVYFLCNSKYQHISSSALRGIRQFSEEKYQNYIVK